MRTSYKISKHGKKIYEIYRSKYKKIVFSLIYALVSAFCISEIINFENINYFFRSIVILISCWRIYVINLPVAIFCENILLILALRDNLFPFPKYEEILYEEVAGVSISWKTLYLGRRVDGSLVKFPVLLNYISKKDQQIFEFYVKNKFKMKLKRQL